MPLDKDNLETQVSSLFQMSVRLLDFFPLSFWEQSLRYSLKISFEVADGGHYINACMIIGVKLRIFTY